MKYNITIEGLKELQTTLENYKNSINDRAENTVKEILGVGEQVASSGFANAHEPNDVTVKGEIVTKTKGNLVANGTQTLFVEFGAGVSTKEGYPSDMPINTPIDISEGSYSKEHNGMFSKYGYWYNKGRRLYGMFPEMPMARAVNAMKISISSILERNFKL